MISTTEDLLKKMREIMHKWHQGTRPGNDGEAGNTLEDLLGIPENNFKIPDFGDIEIKSQKFEGRSNLLTLFHKEPEPKASVPKLLKGMGWRHEKAGTEYPEDEMSFRSTTYGHRYSDRGLTIRVDHDRYNLIYDPKQVNRNKPDTTGVFPTYGDWADDIEQRSPQYRDIFPVYYNVPEIMTTFKEKLNHTLLVFRKTRKTAGKSEYRYEEAFLMDEVRVEQIGPLIEQGILVIDFDARTHHNHGTKYRIKKSDAHQLFTNFQAIEELE